MEQNRQSDSRWNPDILTTAFDESVWTELDAFVSAAAGAAIERKRVVEYVAALPWHVVTTAVSHGFVGVPKKQLLDALAAAVRRIPQ